MCSVMGGAQQARKNCVRYNTREDSDHRYGYMGMQAKSLPKLNSYRQPLAALAALAVQAAQGGWRRWNQGRRSGSTKKLRSTPLEAPPSAGVHYQLHQYAAI